MTDHSELTRKQQARLKRDQAIVGHVEAVAASLPVALAHAHEAAALITTSDAPGSGLGERVNTSGHSDPTLGAVLSDERICGLLDDLRGTLLAWQATAIEVFQLTTRLSSATLEKPHTPPSGSGECKVCGEWVPGVAEQRLKRGMCPAHYQQWTRDGRPEIIYLSLNPDIHDTLTANEPLDVEAVERITWHGRTTEEEAA